MILRKDMLTKALKKRKANAINLLNELSRIGDHPEPRFQYTSEGYAKKPVHFYKVQFRVPKFLNSYQTSVVGTGKCTKKADAKSLAALEALCRLEEDIECNFGDIEKYLEEQKKKQQEKKEILESTPVENPTPGVGWSNLPIDPMFGESKFSFDFTLINQLFFCLNFLAFPIKLFASF